MFTKEQIEEIHRKLLQLYSKKDIEVDMQEKPDIDKTTDSVVIVKENGDNKRIKIGDISMDVTTEPINKDDYILIFTQ